jgi:DMSO/TMAO reductase YedYZ molybdopterin-dependent catalytic subunit
LSSAAWLICDYCSQQSNTLKGKRSGNGGDDICADQQFYWERDAASDVGPVTGINRSPVPRARTIARELHHGQDYPAKDDCYANELERLGKLINWGMGLLD